MRTIAGVMVAGGLGAAARYGVDGVVSQHLPGAFPWGTFVVNVSASLLLGIVFAVATNRLALDSTTRIVLMTGFIGSYSTFSTLVLQSVLIAESGAYGLALLNAAGSVVIGLVAVVAGILIGRVF